MHELDPADQGQGRGVWPHLDSGQARAGASAGSPAQSGRAGGGDAGSIDQTGAPPPLPVRPRWGRWAGGAAAAGPAIGREGQAGWPAGEQRAAAPREARSRPELAPARPAPFGPAGPTETFRPPNWQPRTLRPGDLVTTRPCSWTAPTPLSLGWQCPEARPAHKGN